MKLPCSLFAAAPGTTTSVRPAALAGYTGAKIADPTALLASLRNCAIMAQWATAGAAIAQYCDSGGNI